jgi:hypothetical protein
MRHRLASALSLFILTSLVTLAGGASASSAGSAPGSTSPISISEIYPAPLTGESEWVELYNSGSESAALAGWTLEDVITSPSTIFIFTTQVIEPESYLVAQLSAAKLNNTGDSVVLKNNQGNTVHSISYEGSSPGLSWSVAAGGGLYGSSPTPGSANAPQPLPSPSPPAATPTASPAPSNSPSPTSTASPAPSASPQITPSPGPSPTPPPLSKEAERTLLTAISLTEVHACPTTGQQEWLELFNSSSEPIAVSSWKVTDEAGNTRYISGTIPAKSYQTFAWSGSLLNNSGDSLTLTTPLGNTVATMEYQACQSGLSLAWTNSDWILGEPTPGNPPVVLAASESGGVSGTTGATTSSSAAGSTTGTSGASTKTTTTGGVLGAQASSTDSQDAANDSLSDAATALTALYAQLPPPQIQPLAQPDSPLAASPQSISRSVRSSSPFGAINVILGGLTVSIAGLYSAYVQLESSPLSLVQRLFATSTLGSAHFLSQLTK